MASEVRWRRQRPFLSALVLAFAAAALATMPLSAAEEPRVEARAAAERARAAMAVSGRSSWLAARADLERARELWRAIGDPVEIARAELALADLAGGLGEHEAALAGYDRALEQARAASDACTAGWAASGRGHVLWAHGDAERAEVAERAAQKEASACSDPELGIAIRLRLALIAGSRGRLSEALELYESLERELVASGDKGLPGRALAAYGAGDVLLQLGRTTDGRPHLALAVELAHASGQLAHEARCRARLGEAERLLGDFAAAKAQLTTALELWRRHGDGEGRAYVLIALARLDREENQWADAQRKLEEALDLLEVVRRSVVSPELRAAFLARTHTPYRELVDLLLERDRFQPGAGFDRAAFRAAERARMRALLDLLTAPTAEGVERGDAALVAADEVQRTVLAADDLMLSFFFAADRVALFVVERDRFRAVTLDASVHELEAVARACAETFARSYERLAGRAAEACAHELGEALLGPVPELAGHLRLLVLADGELAHLPFAALVAPVEGDAPLVERHEVVLVPSASAIVAQRARRRQPRAYARELLLVADPVYSSVDARLEPPARRRAELIAGSAGEQPLARLPGTAAEVARIQALARGRSVELAVGFAATREWALSGALSGARYLHFASHALADAAHPESAGLALSALDREGNAIESLLRLEDLRRLRLDADLVVLSACSTRGGRTLAGEGPQSLSRGFIDAGAARVVGTLWPVRDEAATVLIESFYRHLLTERRSPAAALRSAQRELRAQARFAAPHDWAGFVLEGDWR